MGGRYRKKPPPPWIPLKKKYPEFFDLVHLLYEDGRIGYGWWNGYVWKGREPIQQDIISGWRKIPPNEVSRL